MIVTQEARTFESSAAARTFQISTNPQMFRILSSGLYEHKELAVIRELLCNAYDAHVAAGTTDTPIEVHMPSILDSTLTIKDFGTGLSPENVFALYTTYGASDKTKSNDLIGGFGLGSKSPLAVSDQFTIESRFNGRKYLFQAALQDDGAPGLVALGDQPTDEPNGMTITVPAGLDRVYTWQSALATLYPFRPVPITVTGIDEDQLPKDDPPTFSVELDDHPYIQKISLSTGTPPESSPSAQNTATVVQGNVPYNLDPNTFLSHEELEEAGLGPDHGDHRALFRQYYSSHPPTRLYIYTRIGTLPLQVSREGFEDTAFMRKRVISILRTVFRKIVPMMRTELVKGIATWWDFSCLATSRIPAAPQVLADVPQLKDLLVVGHPGFQAGRNIPTSLLSDQPALSLSLRNAHRKNPQLRRNPALSVTRKDLPHTLFLTSEGHKRYREQALHLLQTRHGTTQIILLDEDFDKVKSALDELGVPHTLERLPAPAPIQRRKSGAGGSARYPVTPPIHAHRGQGFRTVLSEVMYSDDLPRTAADQIVEAIEGISSTGWILYQGTSQIGLLTALAETWALKLPKSIETLRAIRIPAAHSRRIEALMDLAPDRVWTTPRLAPLINRPRLARIMALHALLIDQERKLDIRALRHEADCLSRPAVAALLQIAELPPISPALQLIPQLTALHSPVTGLFPDDIEDLGLDDEFRGMLVETQQRFSNLLKRLGVEATRHLQCLAEKYPSLDEETALKLWVLGSDYTPSYHRSNRPNMAGLIHDIHRITKEKTNA